MMMGFGLIFVLLAIAAVAFLAGWRPSAAGWGSGTPAQPRRPLLDVLQERYARGEITKEQYDQMRKDLGV